MYQKGGLRREEILRATLRLIGERGADAVTHRAVAEEAGVALSATTYYFASKEELLEQTLLLAAREEIERVERLVLEIAPLSLSVAEWAAAVSGQIAGDVAADPAKHVALFDARVVVATLTGLMLQQLASGLPDFETAVMRPTLERLFGRLAGQSALATA
jgi:DNA-binding transcriptional regulator YbjK